MGSNIVSRTELTWHERTRYGRTVQNCIRYENTVKAIDRPPATRASHPGFHSDPSFEPIWSDGRFTHLIATVDDARPF